MICCSISRSQACVVLPCKPLWMGFMRWESSSFFFFPLQCFYSKQLMAHDTPDTTDDAGSGDAAQAGEHRGHPCAASNQRNQAVSHVWHAHGSAWGEERERERERERIKQSTPEVKSSLLDSSPAFVGTLNFRRLIRSDFLIACIVYPLRQRHELNLILLLHEYLIQYYTVINNVVIV